MKTFLAIGDEKDFDSFNKFVKQQTFLTEHGFSFKTADYNSVFRGELPEVKTKNLVIFLFSLLITGKNTSKQKNARAYMEAMPIFSNSRNFGKTLIID